MFHNVDTVVSLTKERSIVAWEIGTKKAGLAESGAGNMSSARVAAAFPSSLPGVEIIGY